MPQLVIEITMPAGVVLALPGAIWTIARSVRLVAPLFNDDVARRAAVVERGKRGKR